MSNKQQKSTIACAENLEYMSTLKDDTIDLIYIDPPFNTGKKQRRKQSKGKDWPKKVTGLEYYDSFSDGISGYVEFMRQRLGHCYRLLRSSGVLCVHLDQNSVHYIKCLLDEIFGCGDLDSGKKKLVNEIIWKYGLGGSSSRCFSQKHDTILVYAKSSDYTFHKPTEPATSQRMKGKDKGMIDVWDIPAVNNMAKERTPYPTQKPLALLERIIKAFSNKGDLVADFFCGCGTTLEAAINLNRKFQGCDGQKKAIDETCRRMMRVGKRNSFEVKNPFKVTLKELQKKKPSDYQRACVLMAEGVPNSKLSSDLGIDGWRISDGAIIQVRKSTGVGGGEIQKLLGVMTSLKRKTGVFIAGGFADTAREFVNSIKDGFTIELRHPTQLK